MDTISRENNTSFLPIAGLIAGVVAALLAIVALVQIGKVKQRVTDIEPKVQEAVDSASSAASAAKSASDTAGQARSSLQTLAGQTQSGFNQITEQLAKLGERVTKIESTPVRAAVTKVDKTGKDGAKDGAGTGGAQADGTYVVKAGEYPAKIAKALGISVDALMAANPGVNANKLKVGQKLNLPKR